MGNTRRSVAALVTALLVAAACQQAAPGAPGGSPGGGAAGSPAGSPAGQATKVRFQLQWVTQAQFAGYYAALDQGYFRDEGLDVTILPGGPDINNLQVVAAGGAELGTSWVPKTLASREGGTDLVTIGQILQRSGTRMVAFKESGITKPADMAGKRIGSWF